MSATPIAADFLWNYRCNGKGCCCKAGWRIGLIERDVAVLTDAARGTPHEARVLAVLEAGRSAPFGDLMPTPGGAARRPEVGEIPKDDAGACAFVAADGWCELHRDLGEEALPRVCQSFPVLAGAEVGSEGPVTGTAWELLCPEVARTLVAATQPARLVSAPTGLARAFVPDPWLATPDAVPIADEGGHRASRAAARAFREGLAARLGAAPDRPFSVLGEALGELLRWDGDADGPWPAPGDDAGDRSAAALLAIAEAARRRFLLLADDRDRVQRTVSLARGFFAHHPWGTAATLEPVARAFGSPLGPLASIDDRVGRGGDFDPDERLVFANWAIARQTLPSGGESSLLSGLARTAIVLIDALFFRFLCDGVSHPVRGVEKATAALALADAHHRGRDAGAARFTDLLWHLGRSRTVARAAAHLGDAGPTRPIGAVLLAELRHQRSRERARAGWLGRLTADWRSRFEAHDAGSGTGTPGLPVTSDAPPALHGSPHRGEIVLAGLAIAVATDAGLRHLTACDGPLLAVVPEMAPETLAATLARLEGRGLLIGDEDAPITTPRQLAVRVAPFLIAAALDAQEAARRPAGAPVQMKESSEAKGSGDAKPAKKPVTMKAMEVRPGEAITEVVVNAGTLKGLAEGDAVSVGHLSGHVVNVSEFRATVKFEAAPSVVQPVLDARGRVLQSGPATEAAPTPAARYAIDVKAPKVQKAPGKPSTVKVYFEVTPDGGKTERYSVSWSGRKERAAILAEALAMLEVARVAIPAMSEAVSADMMPYAEKITDAIMKHL